MRAKQLRLIKQLKSDYGGELRKTRAGRAHGRPISTKHTMHLVLRSNQAKGEWNFRLPKNDKNIRRIVKSFAAKYGVKVLSFANAWNHLHLQIRLSNRFTYQAFIRATTSAIAMSVTGRTRWAKRERSLVGSIEKSARGESKRSPSAAQAEMKKFWDHRPFTRIADSYRAFLRLADYVRMNQIEGDGWQRGEARSMAQVEKIFNRSS